MDNPETLATLGRQDTGRRQNKTQKTKTDEQHVPHQQPGMNPCARER